MLLSLFDKETLKLFGCGIAPENRVGTVPHECLDFSMDRLARQLLQQAFSELATILEPPWPTLQEGQPAKTLSPRPMHQRDQDIGRDIS